tara:strand:- start:62 stop:214 length:153 start_codon:yes stop_codon:yes gene_type:complete
MSLAEVAEKSCGYRYTAAYQSWRIGSVFNREENITDSTKELDRFAIGSRK